MLGISIIPLKAIIAFALLVLCPIALWGLYKLEINRDKKHSKEQALKGR